MGRATSSYKPRKSKGFRRAATLVSKDIREVGEARGFAVSRVLTHWAEIAGAALAETTRPLNISYARDGMGGTLTILTTGANAPLVEMQTERLRERVNACYGFNAISRIRVTQTAPTGFAEGRATFLHAPETPAAPPAPAPEIRAAAADVSREVGDDTLRDALENLGANILSRKSNGQGQT